MKSCPGNPNPRTTNQMPIKSNIKCGNCQNDVPKQSCRQGPSQRGTSRVTFKDLKKEDSDMHNWSFEVPKMPCTDNTVRPMSQYMQPNSNRFQQPTIQQTLLQPMQQTFQQPMQQPFQQPFQPTFFLPQQPQIPQQPFFYPQAQSWPINMQPPLMHPPMPQQQQPQQPWFNYQQQSAPVYQGYNYWYGEPRSGMKPHKEAIDPRVGIIPESFHQPINTSPLSREPVKITQSPNQPQARRTSQQKPQLHNAGSQTPQLSNNVRTTGGLNSLRQLNTLPHGTPLQPLGNDILNRINSITSFENMRGSRIRDSQQDLVEYRRIAARTIPVQDDVLDDVSLTRTTISTATSTSSSIKRKLPKKQKVKVKCNKPTDDKQVICAALGSKSTTFLRRLGIKTTKSNTDTQSRQKSKSSEQPSTATLTKQLCQAKKPSFFRRLFGDVHDNDVVFWQQNQQKSVSQASLHYPTETPTISQHTLDFRDTNDFLRQRKKKETKPNKQRVKFWR